MRRTRPGSASIRNRAARRAAVSSVGMRARVSSTCSRWTVRTSQAPAGEVGVGTGRLMGRWYRRDV